MTPDELWEKYVNYLGTYFGVGQEDFMLALAEYGAYIGASVRARDVDKWRAVYDAANAYAAEYEIAEDCGELQHWPEGEIERAKACFDACNTAAAIENMELP